MKRNISKIEIIVATILAVLLIVVIPLLNLLPETVIRDGNPLPNFWHVSDFNLNLWGKYLCYGMLAISVDLMWGYTGLLSLGQALFFSLGGYMLGMHLMLQIGKLGQYYLAGNNDNLLPDFMVFLGLSKLPSFWQPFYSFPLTVTAVLLVPGLLALIFGFLAFRSRIKGVYFSILTQALTYCAALMFFRNSMIMGGNNGFTDFKFILGFDVREPATQRGLFIATSVLLIAVYIFCRWLTTTKFGLVQRAIRDSENRVLFSGYAAANYKLFIFVFSALIASVGGALYVPQVGIINPSEMWPDKSLEAVVWCAVGGRGTLVGPVIGAISVNWLKSWATRSYPDLWLIILGTMFILIVLFMPKGIVGIPAQLRTLFRRKPPEADNADKVEDEAAEPSTPIPSNPANPV